MTDAFHRTRSSPDGKPIIGCIASAIKDAGLTPDDIDYVNAHGTSTPENDKMEYLGVSTVLGERAKGRRRQIETGAVELELELLKLRDGVARTVDGHAP